MKTIATFVLFMIFGTAVMFAQEVGMTQPVEKPYSWNETTHDFGKIPVSGPAEVTFTVTNKGNAPLLMTAAKSSCGCTVAEYTKEPIKSGESGIVKATYNAARQGTFTKTVIVTFDGVAQGDVLTLKGEVQAPAPAGEPAPVK
jgi:hypothetical protein